ncbi:MAG: hypothetical protein COZ17_01200 [Flavobacteriaceae bacterium CG_4_10_14_3_um_filter_33_47]|nr:MAG: hypothetical protein COW44_03115 [Flavobacteriaceae bacterium CG17_big_fil_post_rev_8_21_14_2_50_33_15]PIY13258.1 MAG: hypothetical protein COZ17_01200 [Flavobacteriaceae bacterium CG_4_10_14_3_um_filter_33_47]PJB16813.1 MAG: hypothetical protein CO117_14045 [Flavobacteriaceae bacterium CG_4_9_14_3_um_filter_33_16]
MDVQGINHHKKVNHNFDQIKHNIFKHFIINKVCFRNFDIQQNPKTPIQTYNSLGFFKPS